ncbi:MAG: DUF362 domain-containing protein [Candidatus Thorarchaeota archaeon]
MSFVLDPPTLFVIGMILALLNKKFLPAQLTRILGFLVVLIFWWASIGLYLDLFVWPFNVFDWTPPDLFEPIGGKQWMLHTDLTGITDIPNILAALIFALYPLFLWFGYEITRGIIDPHAIRIVSKRVYNTDDVRSRLRARQKTTPVLLSTVRNPDPRKAVREAVRLVGGIIKFIKPGDHVVIKPNISGGNPEVPGSYTSIEVVDVLIDMIREVGGIPTAVVDSDMVWTDFEDVARAEGWMEWSKHKDVPLINLRKTDCVRFDFGTESKIGVSVVSKLMLDADVIVSIPTMKTHLLTGVTLGMKNFYGTLPEGDKAKYHKTGIEDVIIDMNIAFPPTLTIIDGSVGGEAIGPLTCRPVNFQTVIVSNDVVTADALAAFMMGFDPVNEIEHIKKAHHLGLGNASVTFDWSSFPYPHKKDGNWIRTDPQVSHFYNEAIELALEIPTMKKFMNAASDFLLYDTATLPVFKNVTPAVLGVVGDIIAGVFNIWGKMRGGRKKARIASKIEEKLYPQRITGEAWPSKKIQDALLAIRGTTEFQHSPTMENAIDLTPSESKEAGELAHTFNPEILLEGVELRSEANTFSGMMYRVLENPQNLNERCIQYLYTWTSQKWFWSNWYNILVPFFLAALGIIIFTQTAEESWFWTELTIGFMVGFLFLAGLWRVLRTLRGWRRTGKFKYVYRHQFILIPYAALFSAMLVELPPRWAGTTYLPPIPTGDPLIGTIYIPAVSLVFIIIPLLVLLIKLQPFFSIFAHKIDYAPVFVYIKKENNHWVFDKVRYDKFHHDVATRRRKELRGKLRSQQQVKLAIPDSWHSMGPSRGFGRFWSAIGFLGFLACYAILLVARIQYPLLVEGMDLVGILVAISLLFAYIFFTKYQSKLHKMSLEDFKEQKYSLTQEKLAILWNLADPDPALKIRQKMQDPFNPSSSFWESFFDMKEEHFVQDELNAVRTRTGRLFSFGFGLVTVTLAWGGFYFGGFWDHSWNVLQTPQYGWILAFLIGFFLASLGYLIASIKLPFRSFFIFYVLVILWAWGEEGIFTTVNFWNYLDGDPFRLIFIILGWPIVFLLVIGMSNWILKYIRLSDATGGIVTRIKNVLPVLALIGLFSVLSVPENLLDMITSLDQTFMLVVSGIIGLLIIFTFLFGATHTFKQNIVLTVMAMFAGAILEIIGHLAGYWTYAALFLTGPYTIVVPNFLIIIWAFRVFSILFLTQILRQHIIRSS